MPKQWLLASLLTRSLHSARSRARGTPGSLDHPTRGGLRSAQRPLLYFIGIRQISNQYANAIKPSMNRSENQFSMFSSTGWFGAFLQERAPQASQYPSSSFAKVRHSQHCFDISRIMPEASRASYPQESRKVIVRATVLIYRFRLRMRS